MSLPIGPELAGTRILLGISAGIAAYKSANLARLLKKTGFEVRVVMTEGAQAFITPLTLQALTGEPVRTSLLDPEAEAGMGHIELAKWADIILIAPTTADLMARLAHGHADDLLTTLCLATEARCLMAPAMNQAMWRHPATLANADRLAELGWTLLGPDAGDQACGDVGLGRMLEPETILAQLLNEVGQSGGESPRMMPVHQDLVGKRVVITAGPTREALDPVRYLSNHSSGKMGYALAAACVERGASVSLVSGPVSLSTPPGVNRIDVTSATEMLAAVESQLPCDLFIGCAAVADYRAAAVSEHKLKKTDADSGLTLELVRNPDIVATVAARPDRPFTVGFAAETQDLETHAGSKLERKRLDLIVANDISREGVGFGSDDNAVTLLWKQHDQTTRRELPAQAKATLAAVIVDHIVDRLP
ncbi:bifunctional 4'-phosphopantothenoylcysteine decarboxylase/phosphopantothenoylcysteine synthetase [Salinicola sp. MH3R3-1]|uniref:bifunctional phosphopantothenoylcysteine decarboxylase/phosphopantothenate--cysteine ligase CoaBC n=1 Tax=Salinicola sp. MH3R3-1 TaxID=1928762 RepID=UPI00094F0B39|nr:bifunctional phosphopantothenoylcysteine decarboxylase/phosphopantothenate--cysteine ligase CoaBC [Salinicola sp. MH3R3-1]OLO07029.1 bifunctional 4'-phosphopantothenoylcysteine decarboxylase/phosphopantothenoylcysteine synthetase [Salinicola sp. MH3R3-1]